MIAEPANPFATPLEISHE
ncbi:hypothetical protein Goari_011869, partial [Gossypium aridum]|nr:hypothetical protein [Gossypium aridum]